MPITTKQRTALTNARDTGNPLRHPVLGMQAATPAARMMVERLQAAGYLIGDKITEAGKAAI